MMGRTGLLDSGREGHLHPLTHVSETLDSSVISKGIEANCETTSYRSLSFGLLDGAALGVGVVLLGVAVWM